MLMKKLLAASTTNALSSSCWIMLRSSSAISSFITEILFCRSRIWLKKEKWFKNYPNNSCLNGPSGLTKTTYKSTRSASLFRESVKSVNLVFALSNNCSKFASLVVAVLHLLDNFFIFSRIRSSSRIIFDFCSWLFLEKINPINLKLA